MKKIALLFVTALLTGALATEIRGAALPAPKGLIRKLSLKNYSTEKNLQKLRGELKDNPYINGVVIGTEWSLIEPERGKFDFAALDALIKVIDQANMDYKLFVMPGQSCPKYIYDGIKEKINTFIINPHRQNFGDKVIIPIPWDPFYKENLKRMFITVFGHYRADKHFIATNLTGANFMSSEWHLPRKRAEDIAQWEAASPDYKNKIKDFWIEIFDFIAALMPEKRMAIEASSEIVYGMDEQADAIIEYGIAKYPGQFMVQINQLDGNSDQITFDAFARLIRSNDRIIVGVQSLASVQAAMSGKDMRQGSMEMSVYNYLQSGSSYWELWDGDGADVATSKAVADQIKFASGLGVQGYKAWLISKGKYIDAKPDNADKP